MQYFNPADYKSLGDATWNGTAWDSLLKPIGKINTIDGVMLIGRSCFACESDMFVEKSSQVFKTFKILYNMRVMSQLTFFLLENYANFTVLLFFITRCNVIN